MAGPRAARLAELARRALGTRDLRCRLDALNTEVLAIRNLLEVGGGPARQLRAPAGPVYLGEATALVATEHGAMMLVDTTDTVVAPTLLLRGVWETTVTSWLRATLRPGQTFVDVGANIGYFTLLAAQLVGAHGKVVAVEAHPRLAELLRRNVVLNDLRNVAAFHRAAWDENGELQFHLRQHFAANSSVASLGTEGLAGLDDQEHEVAVPGVRLDDLLAGQLGMQPGGTSAKVDVVKIDVEGAELQALTGLQGTLRSSPQVRVMFEWSPGQLQMVGTNPGDLLDLFTSLELRFRLIEDGLACIDRERLLNVPYGNVVAAR